MSKLISKETKDLLISTYSKRPITISDVSKMFNLSNPTVIKILKEYKVKEWTKAQLFSPELQTDYFKEIDTPAKAYYLGLLTTDGCIFWKNKKTAFLALELKEEDAYIIESFLSEIKCNKKLIHSSKSKTYSVQIHCTDMVQDLESHNLEQRSSFTQRLSCKIDKRFIRDYVRGLFDGDGSYGFYSRPNRAVHRKLIRISSGSKQFIDDVIKMIESQIKVSEPSVYYTEHDHSYTATWTKVDDVEAIIGFLYYDDCVCLLRKKKTAQLIVNEIRQYRDNRINAAS